MYTRNEKIIPVYIEDEMKNSYIDYAMSVIVGRALPDIRDGLKPVHRRILYAMKELNLDHSKPHKKCARIVGEVLGKYHPHGDVAIYDALARMVQDFSLRYPLVDGQGNFGSIDGDAPAAMRYTEARHSAITDYMLKDIEKDTVQLAPNFDGTLTEPTILPATLPNLLINGSSGIAVGMATNIPPHNLGEVLEAVLYLIDYQQATIKDLMRRIKGPDFPTGGAICGREGIKAAYETGRGLLKLRARAGIQPQKGGKETIIITDIPYQANKSNILEQIAALATSKRIEGISDLRDESGKEGIRIVVELKKGAEPQVVLNKLYKHTQLEGTFGVIMLALVDGKPQLLNLKQTLEHYIEHRRLIITRRLKFELKKARERAHILEGLKIALSKLDAVVNTIKHSKTPQLAREALVKKFKLSEIQAQAILEMQLQRLTSLEREKIDKEYLELIKKIELYQSILKDPKKVLAIIREEALEMKKKFGDDRKTEIVGEITDFEIEDLIAQEDVVITISHSGYVKRLPVSAYKRQHRGGKGVIAASIREEDFIEDLFIARTHDYLLFFTDKGKVYWLKVHEIPQVGRTARGKAIVNLINISSNEAITSFVPVKEFNEGYFLVMATKKGVIKKTRLDNYSHPRKGGIVAIKLRPDDRLIGCALTDGKQEILLATKEGKAIRFKDSQVRSMGRGAAGVRGMRLSKKDEVVGMEIVKPKCTLLSVTEKGFGKRTAFEEYRIQSRGGSGIINIKTTDRNGRVVGVKSVADRDETIIITQTGMVVRCPVKGVRTIGRNTQGVKLMSLKSKDRVVSVAKVAEKTDEEGAGENHKAQTS